MEISKMRSRITIQKNTVETDATGNHTAVWKDYYSCYAYATLLWCVTVRLFRIWTVTTIVFCSRVASTTLRWWMIFSSGTKR